MLNKFAVPTRRYFFESQQPQQVDPVFSEEMVVVTDVGVVVALAGRTSDEVASVFACGIVMGWLTMMSVFVVITYS